MVASSLQSLGDFDLIKRKTTITSNLRNFTEYNLNDDSKSTLEIIKSKNKKNYDTIKKIVDYSEKEGMNYNVLSYAAKIHYILKEEHRKLSDEELIQLANYYDWKLSEKEIALARNLLESLNLVKFS